MLKTAASGLRHASTRSTTASGSIVYESERAAMEYLQFHYGQPDEVAPYPFAPKDALAFLHRTVADTIPLTRPEMRHRALEVGCSVGRSSFELSRTFDEVIGIDFSHHFIDVANQMKAHGSATYEAHIQGDITATRTAAVPAGIDRTKVHFEQGDACDLGAHLGTFDCVFASNLLCRVPRPRLFLDRLPSLIKKDGILALVSPYSWLEEYTPKEHWIGATPEAGDSFAELERILSTSFELVERTQYPFLIREHDRKFQWGVSDGTFWRRK
ncbi:hypothetical protein SPRG_05212 [Saprolegnia parasitica CBS 223.65]|uniref:Methyltransferase type 11 domain-containing protein n=1 Tax=Saprolegnia parasitica (strain CBS 223.65) TaxID=695850 RepID=A0A067CT99_SAPPC|nr:hypothetical protein SPRG_05212 [Saprolegnia parasitica CBS 223.65]KDO30022.1 hypothetical protein SPRG_05212 [Saprolegnia parasitica CBS 223.65]|eukprot:XP_012199204.1 hypothetical protein SPRG_05212 [Saprolegnia parasitica CBS 223.65]